jgi:hypothetical protein
MPRPISSQHGQASVELTAVVPALALAVALGWQCLLVAYAAVEAEAAAHAAARAALVEEDPRRAARAALPGSMRDAAVRVGDREVSVRVRIPAVVPWLDAHLSASAPVVEQ